MAPLFFCLKLKLLEVGDVRSNLESAQPEEVGLDT